MPASSCNRGAGGNVAGGGEGRGLLFRRRGRLWSLGGWSLEGLAGVEFRRIDEVGMGLGAGWL